MAYFEDEELSKVKAACFRGLARVQLHALHFDHPLVERKHRSISQKNVRRLQRVFGEVGCLRLQEENYINAVVDDASLDKALSLSRDELLCLREGQELPLLDVHVDCLSGLHRIEAAKAILDNNDQWWVVRLFTKGKRHALRLLEHYSSQQKRLYPCFPGSLNCTQTSKGPRMERYSEKYACTIEKMIPSRKSNGGHISTIPSLGISASFLKTDH